MTRTMSKGYRKKRDKSALRIVKKSQERRSRAGKRYSVNRFLLKLRMLEKGVETFAELNRRLGYSEGNKWNISHLVRGAQWRPGLARRIEKFLGVREGEIFRREEE